MVFMTYIRKSIYLSSVYLYFILSLEFTSLAQSPINSLTIGDSFLAKAEFDSARFYYKQIASIQNEPIIQYNLAQTYRYIIETESKIARSILHKVISSKQAKPLLIAQSYNLLGIHYRYNDQPDSAKICLEKAIQLGKKQNYFRPYAELVHYYINSGDLVLASKLAFDGIRYIEKYKDYEALPYMYFQLASLNDELGKSDKMFFYANKALSIEKNKPYSDLLGDIYEIIGLYYGNRELKEQNKNDALKAIKYYNLSYTHFEKVKQIRGMGFQLIHLAMKKASIGKIDEAKADLDKAESLFLALHRPQSMGAFYLSYGDFLFTYNINKKKGMENIHKAADIWKKNHRKSNLAVAYEALSIGYSRLSDYKKSLEFMQKYYELNQEITGEKAQKELQALNLKYETEKKDAQLKEQQITILKERQRLTFLGLITAIGIILIGLSFYIYRIQQKRKLKKLETSFEQTTRQLQSFNYSVSHDLRHPIISSMAAIKKLNNTPLNNEQQQHVQKISHSINNMNLIIDAMLNLVSIEKEELMIKKIDIEILIKDVIDSFNCTAKVNLENLPTSFNADISLIRQVFVNLISNAIKYSEQKENPEITIKGTLIDNKVKFTITDNGIGFDEKFNNKLFQLFGRLHPNINGIGVGLVIVKRIIEKHGGIVYAKGKMNEGASFGFEIPQ